MTRKKRQALPCDEEGSTDDDKVIKESRPTCPHVGKAVHISALKRTLKSILARIGRCGACVKERRAREKLQDSSEELVDVWLCLRCGAQCCGGFTSVNELRTVPSHVLNHFKVPRSDQHFVYVCVSVGTENGSLNLWSIVCFECQDELYVDSYKKLREALNFVQDVATRKPAVSAVGGSKKVQKSDLVNAPSTKAKIGSVVAEVPFPPRGRGLTNLGNTCFFNAVAQCLCHSHPLMHMVNQHSQKEATLTLPNEIQIQLPDAGSILLSLTAFMKEMNSVGKSGVHNPGHLFGQVCQKFSQFRGNQQHDAHELLRRLMDSLKSEEAKRQKAAILKLYGLSEKTDPKTVSAGTKHQIQGLSKHGNHTLVDKIFGGQLVSTIVCEHCQYSSQIYEPFLDLSLPLVEEKPTRPTGTKKKASQGQSDDNEDPSVSCSGPNKKSGGEVTSFNYKSRKRERKEKRRSKRQAKKRQPTDSRTEEKLDKYTENANISEVEADAEDAFDSKGKGDATIAEESVKIEEGSCDNEDEERQENQSKSFDDAKDTEDETKTSSVITTDCIECQENSAKHNGEAEEGTGGNKRTKTDVFTRQVVGGSEEEDEDDAGYSDEEDWDWDYGDHFNDAKGERLIDLSQASCDSKSEHLLVASDLECDKKDVLVSLNPLPQDFLIISSSEREKSSDPAWNEDGSSSSSNADVEDNVDETNRGKESYSFQPDPNRLDPHMEQLCRNVRRLSVSSTALPIPESFGALTETEKKSELFQSVNNVRSKVDWVARSLTSIAPKYHAQPGECSIYSCLTQFTSPELLTGNNKWACDRCTRVQADQSDNATSDHCQEGSEKSPVVYTNASKQILVFNPPSVLTIHLKRFQQTVYNLRKVNRHVQFPLVLDVASFCSTTSVSAPNVSGTAKEINYDLYGVVEHSGRLRGGHYTAFVKSRPTDAATNFSRFYSSPSVNTDEILTLMENIEKKLEDVHSNPVPDSKPPRVGKWYHISDANVVEVSEDRVLKCQAYLLFYERIQ